MKQLLDYFSKLGSKYHLKFSGQEILTDCILGFDGVNQKLLVLSGIRQGRYNEQVIDLNSVSRFALKKYYGSIQANALTTATLDHFLEKMVVQIDFNDQNRPVDIPFYHNSDSTVSEVPLLEKKAKRWSTLLSKLLKKRSYHVK